MENFNFFLEDLEKEYPKPGGYFISTNNGRPMKIELKSGVKFGVAWFRWEYQNEEDLRREILCFNTGNKDSDKFYVRFSEIKLVYWD